MRSHVSCNWQAGSRLRGGWERQDDLTVAQRLELYALLQDEETTWRQQISCFLYPIPPEFSCFPLSYTPPCWKYCRQTESSGILASFLQRQRIWGRNFVFTEESVMLQGPSRNSNPCVCGKPMCDPFRCIPVRRSEEAWSSKIQTARSFDSHVVIPILSPTHDVGYAMSFRGGWAN